MMRAETPKKWNWNLKTSFPEVGNARREVREVYQGDGPQNGYERLGRVICAALLAGVYLVLGTLFVVAPFGGAYGIYVTVRTLGGLAVAIWR